MQKKFWMTYGSTGTIDDMFLSSQGQTLDEMERPEVPLESFADNLRVDLARLGQHRG